MCQRQVEAIQNALSATQNGIGFNNCVTMPLNYRTVVETNPLLSASTVDAAATETSDITNTSLLVSFCCHHRRLRVPGSFARARRSYDASHLPPRPQHWPFTRNGAALATMLRSNLYGLGKFGRRGFYNI